MGVLSSAYTAQSGPPNAYPTNKKQGGTGGSSSRTSSSVPSIGLGSVPGPSSRPPAVPNPNDIIVQNPGADYAKSLTDTFNGLMAANASQMAGFGNSVADANRKLAYQPALYGNSQDALTNSYNQGVANININRIGNVVDQNAAQRDIGYYGDVYNNTLKGYLTNYDFVNQQQGFSTRDYLSDWDFLNQQSLKSTEDVGFRDQGFDNQLADAGMAQKAREQQIREQLATGGGGFTQGLDADRGQSNYMFDAAGRDVGLQRNKSWSDYRFEQTGIVNDRTKLQTGYDRDIAGFDNQRKNMNIDLERSGLDRNQQQAQANDRLGQLRLESERYNIDQDALESNLQNQLERLGLENQLSTGQLLDAIRNGNTQQQQLAQQIFMQAVANTPKK
jgi:hypothetical protein